VYKLKGTQLLKIKETQNYYKEIVLPGETKALLFKNVISKYCFSCDPNDYAYNEYSYKTVWHYLDKSIEKSYDEQFGLSLITTSNNYYDTLAPYAHYLTTGTKVTGSDGTSEISQLTRQSGSPALITDRQVFTAGNLTKGERVSYNGKSISDYYFQDPISTAYIWKYHYDYQENRLMKITTYPGTGSELTKRYLWGYHNAVPIAELISGKTAVGSDDYGATSFEFDHNESWMYSGKTYNDILVKTGTRYYKLNEGSISKTLSAGTYKLEYWAKSPVTISGGAITPIRTSPPDASGWILYESKLVANSTVTLTLSGNAIIDELRVYPFSAQMNTYAYDSSNRLTSVCDPNNFITYYDYDSFGRLKWIKDDNGNIIKAMDYHYREN